MERNVDLSEVRLMAARAKALEREALLLPLRVIWVLRRAGRSREALRGWKWSPCRMDQNDNFTPERPGWS